MRNTSANNDTGIVLAVTQPMWLLEMFYATPIRICSRETTVYDGNSYTGTPGFEVNWQQVNPEIRLFNSGLTVSAVMISEGMQGILANLYLVYGVGPFNAADADLWTSGQMGGGEIGKEFLDFSLIEVEPHMSPNIRATDDIGFHHLPVDGTEFLTDAGNYILRRK